MTAESRHDQMREQCQAFHAKNPEVWRLFVQLTFDRIGRGCEHWGAQNIIEVIRWQTAEAEVNPVLDFKINNNFTAFYARRFARVYPEHKDFLRYRYQVSHDAPAVKKNQLGPSAFPYEEAS